jgi:hypothetical protein
VLIITGVTLWIWQSKIQPIPNVKSLDIKISNPAEGDIVGMVDVRGTMANVKLPKGFSLRVLRGYPDPAGSIRANQRHRRFLKSGRDQYVPAGAATGTRGSAQSAGHRIRWSDCCKSGVQALRVQ